MIIGIDVGGTNTDAVLLGKQGIEKKFKETTNSADLFQTILICLKKLLDNVDPKDVKRIVLSTTLTTNAIVQRKMGPVGMIVTAGPGINPAFFKPCEHYYCVSGSINHRGVEKAPLNESEILEAAAKIKKAGIEYLGVVGKFSVRNPTHELQIKEILDKDFKQIFLGHHVSGNLSFPRRITTTYINAGVFALHKNFFEAINKALREMGLSIPLRILKADGGTMTLEASMSFPGQTVLSGPAASIMGAIPYAPEKQDAIVLDIGGTTTDIALFVDKAPLLEPVGIQWGDYKSLIRSLWTASQGIGGDSLVRVQDGKLSIGPDRKGPAMAFGGPEPTPTDALVVMGLMLADKPANAQKGIHSIAQQLGLEDIETADMIFKKCCNIIIKKCFEMIDKINKKPVYTVHEFLEKYQFSPEKILLLGGPAPCFAEKIEEMYQIKTIAIPESSVANAIGAALARTTSEVSLNADTELGTQTAYRENFIEKISHKYGQDELIQTANRLLKEKALKAGADPENIDELEVIELHKFNIVRGFRSRGKLFRTKVQIKPGLIKGFENKLSV
jgi:N-methylhydantoinase A